MIVVFRIHMYHEFILTLNQHIIFLVCKFHRHISKFILYYAFYLIVLTIKFLSFCDILSIQWFLSFTVLRYLR